MCRERALRPVAIIQIKQSGATIFRMKRKSAAGLPWYAVRAYYAGGPWCSVGAGAYGAAGWGWGGNYTCYSGWPDYKARNGIVCDPGTVIKGGDAILYMCQ